MPDGSGGMKDFLIDNSVPAWKNSDFLTGFTHMLLVSRRSQQFSNEHELGMIQYAMKLSKVTCRQVYDGFWKAFNDPYVPSTGIEWKHIYRHIWEARKKLRKFTYDEMSSYCVEHSVSTDLFTPVRSEGEIVFWILKDALKTL